MAVIDINWKPSRKDLRVFAAMMIVFFAIVSAVVYRRTGNSQTALLVFGIAATIGLIGLILPILIKPIYLAWMAAAFPIGWVGSYVLLGAVYFLIFMPVGLIMRAFGRDPMNRQLDRSKTGTYWISRTRPDGSGRYFKQY